MPAEEGIKPPKEGEFELLSGRHIVLRELRQYRTYEGLLVGLPTEEMNKNYLRDLVSAKQDNSHPQVPSVLIPPAETPIKYSRDNRPYPFGTPSALPRTTCIGRFASLDPVRDNDGDCSELVIIWLQEAWAFPIDPVVVSQLRKLDWDRFAANYYY